MVTIVGTGWTEGQLTLDAMEALRRADRIILHTGRCGCAEWLRKENIAFDTLDKLYDDCEDFDEHVEAAACAVLAAAEAGDVVYGVFDIRDRSAARLAAVTPKDSVRVIAGPPAEGALLAYVTGETRSLEASDWENFHLSARDSCLIREMDGRELAAEVKLRLMEVYPEDTEVWMMNLGETPASLPLYELDRGARYDHTTCVLVPARTELGMLDRYDFDHLNEIIRRLCAPDGCPWDRIQTHESLRPYMLEEACEVVEAIDAQEPDHLYEELGDVLLQVALHAEIARKHGEFDISDVTTSICEKMLARHPHVFGLPCVYSPNEVSRLWDKQKMNERGQTTRTETLQSVSKALPALMRAVKTIKRSAGCGLRETDEAALYGRCEANLSAMKSGNVDEGRLGDLLFELCAVAQAKEIDPEIALNGAIRRFVRRFAAVEAELSKNCDDIADLPPETLRKYWDSVKL